MKGTIISNGSIENYNKLRDSLEGAEFIVAVDGGIKHLMKINKKPNLILGDLDSIDETCEEYIRDNNIKTHKFSPIKDKTDTHLAVEYLIENRYSEIQLMGVTGSRQDHTISNIFLLDYLLKKNIKASIVDDNNIIFLLDDYIEIKRVENTYISVIPITEVGIIVSLNGFFYELDNEHISFGQTRGISNEIVKDYGKIKIHSGKALVFISED